jgi:hypothetical protein
MRVPPYKPVRGVSVEACGKQHDFQLAEEWLVNSHGHLEIMSDIKFFEGGKCSFSTHKTLGYFGHFDRVWYMDEVQS